MSEPIIIQEPGETDFVTTISVEQQANLRRLADHLLQLPATYPDFSMRLFVDNELHGRGHHPAFRAECGTAACAVGHGPVAGIDFVAGENWISYSYRAFVPSPVDEDGQEYRYEGAVWEWCFGSGWSDTDNTAHGAAHRINWLLTHGAIPDDAQEQREGEAEISYWPEGVRG
ncbi:hypothetical protein SAMN03159338_1548 [Sphingomonas sp. NFR04]|uniref:hypothetical protein n=1 Tax=Sphingomonas sp. NFR04 TaxID=1566283 RepID=UPI0008E17BF1|nr:hypothetical protein [Sphingomonas sp. NFR04]SFJ49151.1 hypothetical protein SAMN03159338_1548 [Sphingomonas sp. NFR04]